MYFETTIFNFFLILLSIIALGFGAELIVKGSINLSHLYKLSGYFIGFTIIALGTSLPEFAASIQAYNLDSIPIAIGNVIGSNIANMLLVLGTVAIVSPIIFPKPDQSLGMLVVTFLICIIFWFLINQDLATIWFGIILIFISIVYLMWQYRFAVEEPKDDQYIIHSKYKSYLYLIIGFTSLYFGSKYFIIGSKEIAEFFKVSEAVIGLTLVAVGTSLPELVTGIAAARNKQSALAIGTILGSNIYNIAAILGIVLFFYEGQMNEILPNDLQKKQIGINAIIMALVTLLFVTRIKFGLSLLKMQKYRFGFKTGIIFVMLYFIYTYYNYYYLN